MKIFFLVLVIFNGIYTNGLCRSRGFVGACFNNNFQQVQRLIQFPTVNYFVGAPIRVQAMIRQELSSSKDYQEFLQFKQWKSQIQQPRQIQQVQQIKPQSLKQQHCAKCHTGQKPKGEFSIDGIFTALERDKAARLVILNKMPKGVQLSPTEKGELIKEILTTDVE